MKGLVEYAKSARAACRQCAGKIEKGSVRLGFVEKGGGGFDVTRWSDSISLASTLAKPGLCCAHSEAHCLGLDVLLLEGGVARLFSTGPRDARHHRISKQLMPAPEPGRSPATVQ